MGKLLQFPIEARLEWCGECGVGLPVEEPEKPGYPNDVFESDTPCPNCGFKGRVSVPGSRVVPHH